MLNIYSTEKDGTDLQSWSVGETFPAFWKKYEKIAYVTADGKELEIITKLFKNLPVCKDHCAWIGDQARFVVVNLMNLQTLKPDYLKQINEQISAESLLKFTAKLIELREQGLHQPEFLRTAAQEIGDLSLISAVKTVGEKIRNGIEYHRAYDENVFPPGFIRAVKAASNDGRWEKHLTLFIRYFETA